MSGNFDVVPGVISNCCKNGREYVYKIIVNDNDYAWGMTVDYAKGEAINEQVFYCPFCGKKLDVIND